MIVDTKDYKCYKFQRNKWFDPTSCNEATLKLVKMVYPDWEMYETQYLMELKENDKIKNCKINQR